jgi:hypothetical protein
MNVESSLQIEAEIITAIKNDQSLQNLLQGEVDDPAAAFAAIVESASKRLDVSMVDTHIKVVLRQVSLLANAASTDPARPNSLEIPSKIIKSYRRYARKRAEMEGENYPTIHKKEDALLAVDQQWLSHLAEMLKKFPDLEERVRQSEIQQRKENCLAVFRDYVRVKIKEMISRIRSRSQYSPDDF